MSFAHAHLRHDMILCGLIYPLGGIISHEISHARVALVFLGHAGRSKLGLSGLQEQEIQESIKGKLGDGAHSDAKHRLFCRGVSSCTFEGPFNPLGSIPLNKHH